MSLSLLADLSTIIQAVFVAISLGFIWYQLRQANKLARAANVQALTEQAAAFNSLLYQDEKLAKLWYSSGENLEKTGNTADRQRYREMLVQWLIFHQNIYYQWQQGLLDKDIYIGWDVDLKFTVHRHNLAIVTKDIKSSFPGSFGAYIFKLQKEQYTSGLEY